MRELEMTGEGRVEAGLAGSVGQWREEGGFGTVVEGVGMVEVKWRCLGIRWRLVGGV